MRLAWLCGIAALVSGAGAQNKGVVPSRVGAEAEFKPLYANSHALLIGINKYKNLPKQLQLSFAANDASAMSKVLVDSYGFAADHVTTLLNEQASLDGIRDALASFADSKRVRPDDRVIVYFSGHGQTVPTPDGGEMGYLIPADAKVDLDDPTNAGPYLSTCLPMKQVWDYLGASPAKHVLVITDACFSGLMMRTRGGLSKASIDVQLGRRARQVLTGGTKGQPTTEREDLGHGLFTAKLLQELKDRALEKGKVFTTSDLYSSIQAAVSNATDGKQTPLLGAEAEGEVLFAPGGSYMPEGVAPPRRPDAPGMPDKPTPGGTVAKVKLSGMLSVTSPATGARVFVGDKDMGPAPYTTEVDLVEVETKSIKVRVEASGFKPAEYQVTLERGKITTINAELEKVEIGLPASATLGGGALRKNPKTGSEVVLVPAGEFTMGSDSPRKVALDAFWIGRNLVTVAEFRAYCQAMSYDFHWDRLTPPWGWKDDHPMVNLTWDEARAYCQWAGGDLPTEAQWEKAARGTDARIYPWGKDFDPTRLWSSYGGKSGSALGTAPVGTFPAGASPFGALDMAGNVWQWCLDWHGPEATEAQKNPTGPSFGTRRVMRGGSWQGINPDQFAATARASGPPSQRGPIAGFRVCLPAG